MSIKIPVTNANIEPIIRYCYEISQISVNCNTVNYLLGYYELFEESEYEYDYEGLFIILCKNNPEKIILEGKQRIQLSNKMGTKYVIEMPTKLNLFMKYLNILKFDKRVFYLESNISTKNECLDVEIVFSIE